MKLYYYEYETCVLRPFFDSKRNLDIEYDLYQGFLVESPLGIVQYFDEKDINEHSSIDDFKSWVSIFYPKNFDIVELK